MNLQEEIVRKMNIIKAQVLTEAVYARLGRNVDEYDLAQVEIVVHPLQTYEEIKYKGKTFGTLHFIQKSTAEEGWEMGYEFKPIK